MINDKIRICVRGAFGLLGNRIIQAVSQIPDMEITLAIGIKDKSLMENLINPSLAIGKKLSHWENIEIYIDGQNQNKDCIELNKNSFYNFIPASQLQAGTLNKKCDIIIDTTRAIWGKDTWAERYEKFNGKIIIQSSDKRESELWIPPLMPKKDKKIYRQGSCALSGIIPLICPIKEYVSYLRVNVVMQYDQPLNDFPTHQQIHTMICRPDLADKLETEIKKMIKKKSIKVDQLIQVPGHDYYTVQINVRTKLSPKELRKKYSQSPRIFLAPKGINSTGQIDFEIKEKLRNNANKDIPPIIIYDNFKKKGNEISITAVLYSKAITMNPNIDAVRILIKKEEPIEAMKKTDKYLGYITNSS